MTATDEVRFAGEPEPTGWETLRAIRELRRAVDSLAAGMVTQGTLAVWQAAQKDKDDRQDARIRDLEGAAADARKTQAQQRFTIVLAIIGVPLSIIAALVTRGIPTP